MKSEPHDKADDGKLAVEWRDIWRWFADTDSNTKSDFLRATNFFEFVKESSGDTQIEILENAPAVLVDRLKPLLTPKAKFRLTGSLH